MKEHALQRRRNLARQIAYQRPQPFTEIALTGSTARGFADNDSDLEINLWFKTLPAPEMRRWWLDRIGAEDILVQEQPRPDDSYWVSCRFGNIEVETGWQTFEALEKNLEQLLSGEVTDRKALALADIIVTAVPLTTTGWLAAQQARLAGYSDALQARLIGDALALWSSAERWDEARRLARRGERVALVEHLLTDVNALLRLLYAVNRRWEPSRKWTLSVMRDFAQLPPEFRARLDRLFSEGDMVALFAALAVDALALVPDRYSTGAAREMLQTYL